MIKIPRSADSGFSIPLFIFYLSNIISAIQIYSFQYSDWFSWLWEHLIRLMERSITPMLFHFFPELRWKFPKPLEQERDGSARKSSRLDGLEALSAFFRRVRSALRLLLLPSIGYKMYYSCQPHISLWNPFRPFTDCLLIWCWPHPFLSSQRGHINTDCVNQSPTGDTPDEMSFNVWFIFAEGWGPKKCFRHKIQFIVLWLLFSLLSSLLSQSEQIESNGLIELLSVVLSVIVKYSISLASSFKRSSALARWQSP